MRSRYYLNSLERCPETNEFVSLVEEISADTGIVLIFIRRSDDCYLWHFMGGLHWMICAEERFGFMTVNRALGVYRKYLLLYGRKQWLVEGF